MLRQRNGTEAGQTAPLLGLNCSSRHCPLAKPSALDRQGPVGKGQPR
jgi:hypothetical protein